jgi:hypothetical protein
MIVLVYFRFSETNRRRSQGYSSVVDEEGKTEQEHSGQVEEQKRITT